MALITQGVLMRWSEIKGVALYYQARGKKATSYRGTSYQT